ncbi:GNAT family N-acetyltransferase [Ornithinimicrobium cerasi]|uniref:Ribosomal protein S18 acetylase RimI n=1 Tax=Ornithinimicrobium cerasi TaxID=2248773 RepID=A0A285VIA4_9MICO|nr:GNAT family N-acetyltransferase [Ornithinimicrobium cerasi]SOC53844.1 Ribosomal protein S18 acetylase RimI [Ornithinimicrobium cerasi]
MTVSAAGPALPAGYTAYPPDADDLDDLARLLRRHEREARGWPGADSQSVAAEVTGRGASTRLHEVVRDAEGVLRAWINCHDRAAGRVLVGVTVDPDLPDHHADPLAAHGFGRAEDLGREVLERRGMATTQLDSGAYADDPRQQRWLAAAGYEQVREWWQMTRPVDPGADAEPVVTRPGVEIRRVRRDDGVGMPQEEDLRAVHLVLEESFADHFNSYRETFEEFVNRLREDPGHRWDHWWLATVDGEPAGALVATTSTGGVDEHGRARPDSTYVEYIGVHRRARGRGVAKSLLRTVVADAAVRGRESVKLEVDAHSPTGADGLYLSLGWTTAYTTQSWHRSLSLPGSAGPGR